MKFLLYNMLLKQQDRLGYMFEKKIGGERKSWRGCLNLIMQPGIFTKNLIKESEHTDKRIDIYELKC